MSTRQSPGEDKTNACCSCSRRFSCRDVQEGIICRPSAARCRGGACPSRRRACSPYKPSLKRYAPNASVAALTAQPLAALPPYGRGVPLAGSERHAGHKFGGTIADRTRLVGGGVLDAPPRKATVFADGFPVIRPDSARLPRQGSAAVHQRPFAVELPGTGRSLSAATDAIGLCVFLQPVPIGGVSRGVEDAAPYHARPAAGVLIRPRSPRNRPHRPRGARRS